MNANLAMTDSPAFWTTESLWQHMRDGLRRFLQARLPSHIDVDDVLHEVFLRIHRGADRLDRVENVQAWVYGIARRTVADVYRDRTRRSAEQVADLSDEANAPAADPEAPDNLSAYAGAHDVHEEVLSWLRPMIDDLPELYRMPLRMADVEGKTQQEVADALGLSLSGAKSRVQRGRKLLGEMLQRCCAIEFGSSGRVTAFHRRHPASDSCDDGCG